MNALCRRFLGRTALVTGLVLTSVAPIGQARAASADPPQEPVCERQVVLEAWVTGGLNVRPKAEQALLGDRAAVCAFLAELPRLAAFDDREQVGRVKALGGPEVAAAANAALRSEQPGAVAAFLDGGWELAREIDLRASVNKMKAVGGPEVKAAANAVLRNGSRGAMGEFIETGWRLPYRIDLRAVVNRAMAEGGPEVQAAANRALQDGSLEMQERFVQIDWGVAQARDDENQTLNDLRTSATEATRRAAFEAVSAVAQAERAKAESAAAKAEAEEAERLASLAGRESAEARKQARRAADAADRAAAASRVAVQAARSAAEAARMAAGAAGRAATAAARAHTKSDEAWAAAARAELDAEAAADAEAYNRAMQQVGPALTAWMSPIDQIIDVTRQAHAAVAAANSARANTEAAGRAAEAAAQHAGVSSAEAKAALAAASRARADAERAKAATAETVRHANVAQDAAGKARDAATRAVSYAEQSARAAASAASHAGSAVNAAELATEHANNAFKAAEDALDAAETAQDVYKAAREADEERIRSEYELELSFARHVTEQAAKARLQDARGFDVPMKRYHTPEIDALIAEATAEGASEGAGLAVAAGKARQVARYFATVPGSWTSSAAMAALGEDDDARVVEFVRSGLAAAEEQDDRTTLTGLSVTRSPAMRAAAERALAGGWRDVVAFLEDPDYPERDAEDRVRVGRIRGEAVEAGDTDTAEAANTALRSEDPDALRTFLDVTYNTAHAIDVRAKVAAIAGDDTNGTEVRNGARVALAGTTAMQVEFLEVERHRAAQRDHATATHNFVATSLMIETSKIAEQAVDFARTAQAAAAQARGAAEEAIGYSTAATQAAGRAREHATNAVAAAQDAARSAERAAQAVRTAAAATKQAQESAGRASLSARWARASAASAAQDAARAFAAYDTAYDAQIRAGNSASEAARIAAEVFEHYRDEAKEKLDTIKAEWYGHCKWGPENGLPTYNDCNQYVEDLLDDPKGPLNDPAGYAGERADACRKQFVGKALDACLSVVMSPLFSWAKRGISDRESETHRLAEEYMGLTALDLLNAMSQWSIVGKCKKAPQSSLGGATKKFRDCIAGVMDLTEDPNWNEYSSQWKGTFVESMVDPDLRFAEYNSILGTMYLQENILDRAVISAIYETDLAMSLLRILPVGCVRDGGDCPYAETAEQLKDVSRTIKQLNNQGYIVDSSGRVLDANGLPIATLPPADDLGAWANYTVESGLHDDLRALEQRLDLLYRREFGVPVPPPALHLETRLAYRVATKEVALQDNTLRLVMNNPGGVCDAVPIEGAGPDARRQEVAGCIQAVKLLLPAGTTMVIYYPNPDSPSELLEVTVHGTGRWLD